MRAVSLLSVLLLSTSLLVSAVYRPPITSTSYPEEIVFSEEFDSLDLSRWSHELTLGGGGNWEFEYYTNNRSNSYARDSILYVKPTLSADTFGGDAALNNVDVNIWGSYPVDMCTSNQFYGCERTGGAGGNIFNPIQSAALRSVNSFSMKYGRIEISARLPIGDWLWPAIWFMPRWDQYGSWPASGEIDLVESRGNNRSYPAGGAAHIGTTLHFGTDWQHDAWSTSTASVDLPSGTFHDDFHIFGLYWDNTTIYSYLDKESNKILNIDVTKQSFWQRGDFGNMHNPWEGQPNIAPFNQEYYLIFNVAVGGTNGYFPEGMGNKPWSNTSPNSVNEFYAAKDAWYSTWKGEDAALQIDWVKAYSLDQADKKQKQIL